MSRGVSDVYNRENSAADKEVRSIFSAGMPDNMDESL